MQLETKCSQIFNSLRVVVGCLAIVSGTKFRLRSTIQIWTAFLAISLVTVGAAVADSDQDRARRAVEQGLILPFKDILAKVQQTYPGQILKAELDDEDDILVYELKILSGDGRVVEVVYDARTGELLKAKDRGWKR